MKKDSKKISEQANQKNKPDDEQTEGKVSKNPDWVQAGNTADEKKKKVPYVDYFSGWNPPPLPIDTMLWQDMFKQMANERITLAQKSIRMTDSLYQASYAVLELCAENYMLEQIIEHNRDRISQLEEKQRKLNETLRQLLKRAQNISLKAEIER